MAALTEDRKTTYQDGVEAAHDVAGGVQIFLGSLVELDSLGLARPATGAAGRQFAGVATEAVDNTTGLDGDLTISLRRQGIHRFDITGGLLQSDVGATLYVVDDQTVSLTPGPVVAGVVGKFRTASIAYTDISAAFSVDLTSATPSGPAGGDLAGLYPDPAVAAITETSGPAQLTIGAIATTELLQRVGAAIVGIPLGAVGVTDHGALTGLADNDHPQYVKSKTFYLESPSGAEDGPETYTDVELTVSKLVAVLRGSSSPSVSWTVRFSSDLNATGTEIKTGGTTTTNTTTGEDVTPDVATIPADSFYWLETTAQSGTVVSMSITVVFA